ncbi:MAG: hypothetical protein LC732_05750 [Acidobacteria bacterium]|nr:hypothetical protein [Acidobacteriota bacterium]
MLLRFTGITGLGGRRTNVGIANPWSTEADVILTLQSGSGEVIGVHALTLAPTSVVQLNPVPRRFWRGRSRGASRRCA